jgi:tetratricopeptide (TPR) repeat protein
MDLLQCWHHSETTFPPPKDPKSSPLLHATKECYFSQLSVFVSPEKPGFEEAKWITSEDVNVEHLLNVFTSTDADSDDVWDACISFMSHLYWHKQRVVMLGPKFEGLPDNHPSKPKCLYQLSWLFEAVGNRVEYKRLLGHTLTLWRWHRNDFQVAETLKLLAEANRLLGLYSEGIQQAKEALGMFKQCKDTLGQADSLRQLARLLYKDNQLDAAEEAASHSIDLLLGKSQQFGVCQGYHLLGIISHFKGETEIAISHLETALEIASSSNWHNQECWIFLSLAKLFLKECRFDDAQAHVEHAKLHFTNDMFFLGQVTQLQAHLWYQQDRFREARSEALHASDIFGKLGAMDKVELCKELLQQIKEKGRMPVSSDASDSDSEPLELVLLLTLLTLLFKCMVLSDDINTILHIKLTYTFTTTSLTSHSLI